MFRYEGVVPATLRTSNARNRSRPIASNDTEDGRAKNRRVETHRAVKPPPVKLAPPLAVLAVLVALPGAAAAAPLDAKSIVPDWGRATQAEKGAWIAGFQFKKADADKEKVGQCLDKYAGYPLFKASDLSGMTRMCETIAELPE